jgi:hypothetical protein
MNSAIHIVIALGMELLSQVASNVDIPPAPALPALSLAATPTPGVPCTWRSNCRKPNKEAITRRALRTESTPKQHTKWEAREGRNLVCLVLHEQEQSSQSNMHAKVVSYIHRKVVSLTCVAMRRLHVARPGNGEGVVNAHPHPEALLLLRRHLPGLVDALGGDLPQLWNPRPHIIPIRIVILQAAPNPSSSSLSSCCLLQVCVPFWPPFLSSSSSSSKAHGSRGTPIHRCGGTDGSRSTWNG